MYLLKVLTFLRTDRFMSSNPKMRNPQPCYSIHTSKLVKQLQVGGYLTTSAKSIVDFVTRACKGHVLTTTPQAFLREGSSSLSVPSKKQTSQVDIVKALQVHKCCFSADTVEKLDKCKYLNY